MREARVVDAFWITGRGLVVALDLRSGHLVKRRVSVEFESADGSRRAAEGYVEVICRRSESAVQESSAIFIPAVGQDQHPQGLDRCRAGRLRRM
jgi:hypothetical protein